MPRHSPHQRQQNTINRTDAAFAGFMLPTSNTTYTPNQFFDVCLPHYSRGVVRIVAYMLRKTLGWCDAEGKPQRERFTISYAEIETEAGINRDMIKRALVEAEEGNFIHCLRKPNAKKAGQPAVSGLYELRWDDRSEYVKNPSRFRGFFAGEGNRTYIPNQFFDHVVRHESLAVVKLVGSIIRFSIGFQNKWGHRRQHVALSYQDIQRYSHLRNRTNLKAALDHALASNYVCRVEDGYFDPNAGRLSRAATYAIRWLNQASDASIGRKSVPENLAASDRSEIRAGIGRKSVPEDRSEIRTGIQIKGLNNNSKGGETAASFEELRKEGFDEQAARAIATKYSADRILRQIEWIGLRRARRNRLGLLRRAIEQDWAKPAGSGQQLGRPNSTVHTTGAAASIAQILAAARTDDQTNSQTS